MNKERFLDIPLDNSSEDILSPITVKKPSARKKNDAEYFKKINSAREDTIIGTTAAIIAGVAIGANFVGAGLSAPITGAIILGLHAHNKLKQEEDEIIRKNFSENYTQNNANWEKILNEDLEKYHKK